MIKPKKNSTHWRNRYFEPHPAVVSHKVTMSIVIVGIFLAYLIWILTTP